VSLKSLWPTVGGVATDLTGVGDVEAVKFVEPVGNRLAEVVEVVEVVKVVEVVEVVWWWWWVVEVVEVVEVEYRVERGGW